MLTGKALDKVVQNSWGGTLSITILVPASGSLIWINFYCCVSEKILSVLQGHFCLISVRTADVSHTHTK